MEKYTVVHLLDDTTPGGVTRVVDHILKSKRLGAQAKHSIKTVDKNALVLPSIKADLIVSHMTISWRSLPGLIALRAKHPKTTIIHVEHSYTQAFTALNVKNRERFFGLLRTAYALFDQVVAVSRAQGSWLVTRGLSNSIHTRIIRSAVDLSAFQKLPRKAGQIKTFGAIGRLHEQKGFDTLIKAFTQCDDPDIRLKIFGEGDAKADLVRLALNDPRISFEGFVDRQTNAYADVDAVLVPSRWEAYGLVAQEALASGCVTLVADVDGLKDQVSDGAIVVTGSEERDWTKAIRTLAAMDESEAAPLYNRSPSTFGDSFEANWERLIYECSVGTEVQAA